MKLISILERIFKGSSKRVLGAIAIFVALYTYVDAHYSIRELNNDAFGTLILGGFAAIIGGVLEKRLNSRNQGNEEFPGDK